MATVVDRSVVVYGQDIYYQEVGAGPTVILLHAAGADGAEWSEVIGPLAARYRVVTPDLVGHGRSGKPSLAYRIGTLADFLAGFLDALGLDRADLVGHSASGAAAATVALRHPARVGRLVLVDAGYAYAVPAVADPRQLGHTPGSLRLLSPATYEDAHQLFALATHRPPAPGEVGPSLRGRWRRRTRRGAWSSRSRGARTCSTACWGASRSRP